MILVIVVGDPVRLRLDVNVDIVPIQVLAVTIRCQLLHSVASYLLYFDRSCFYFQMRMAAKLFSFWWLITRLAQSR